ncbi:MAG: spore coat protein U domain-containing protein [Pseudobdellovibrionaceae bacterium]
MKIQKKFALSVIRNLILGFSLTFFFSQAQAACGLTITTDDISLTWGLNFSSIAVPITINRSTADACNYALGFTKGNGASYVARRAANGSNTLSYQLYKDTGLSKILKDNPDITTIDDVVDGGFLAGAIPVSQTVNYYFDIPYASATTPVMVSSGTYTDNFTLNLYEGSGPPFGTLVASKGVNITVTVPKMIALSLVDPGAPYQQGQLSKNVNFGTMTEGSAANVDLRLRTNAGFSVTFSSANNGKMKHTSPGKNSLVPYSLMVNGATLNLSNSSTVPVVGLTGSGSTALSGLGYPIKVVIGSVTGPTVLGGPHSDDITITATTTE